MSSRDFLAKRVRTRAIIGSGDNSERPSLLVYPETSAINNFGGFTNPNMLEHVGTDVINFFSGSIGSMVYTDEDGITQPHNGERGVNLFGGDIHVSGTLLIDGSVISNGTNLGEENLKGYQELGDFLLTQEVTGDNSVAIGNYLTASSNESIVIGYENSVKIQEPTSLNDKFKYIIGGTENTTYSPNSYIFGGSRNEISGSGLYNLIVGGRDNSIHPEYSEEYLVDIQPQKSGIINSYNTKISGSLRTFAINTQDSVITRNATSNLLLNASSVYVDNLSQENVIIGQKIDISATDDPLREDIQTDFNFIFANNTQIKESSRNIIFGLNEGDTYDAEINPRGYFSLTGSNDSFVIGKKNLNIDSSRDNFIFSGNSTRKNSLVLDTDATTISSVTGSFIFGDNLSVSNANDSFIAATNDLTIQDINRSLVLNVENANDNDTLSITKPDTVQIDRLNELKRLTGISDITYLFDENSGFNSLVSTKDSNIQNSAFSSIFGGFNQNINGVSNGIFGGFSNSINSKSSGSYIIGGYNNEIGNSLQPTQPKENSVIIGNNNTIDTSYSFILGENNTISSEDNTINGDESFIIGRNNTIKGNNSFILGSQISLSDDNRIILGSGDSNKLSVARNTSVILSSSYFVFGDLNNPQIANQYGTEVNFFASGSIGSRERHFADPNAGEYGVAVFGGDVHISGTLSGGNFGIEDLFRDGGDAKGRDRTLGNNDSFDLSFLTAGKERMKIDEKGSVCIGPGDGNEFSLLHVRTGSHESFDFQTSKDHQPAKFYPFVISRDVDNVNAEGVEYEVGMAFQVFPQSQLVVEGVPQYDEENNPIYADNCNITLEEEPGAAITHYQDTDGSSSQGGLKFKTKTSDDQYTDAQITSLTTKMKLTSEGYLLLGNDNPNDQVIDLRATGSDYPLIQAAGSTENDRTVFLMDFNTPDAQADTNFYVKGTPETKDTQNRGTGVFGGDLVVSGNLYGEMNFNLDGQMDILGNIVSQDNNMEIQVPRTDAGDGYLKLKTVGDYSKIELATERENPGDITNTEIEYKARLHRFYSSEGPSINPTYVYVGGHVAVRDNVTASIRQGEGFKGNGEQISNVNLSSVWEEDPNVPGLLTMTEDIDGNTGLLKFELSTFKDDLKKLNLGQITANELDVTFTPSNNTRLYDAYLEIEKDEPTTTIYDTLRVKVYNSNTGQYYFKPVSTIRVNPEEHMIITPKI